MPLDILPMLFAPGPLSWGLKQLKNLHRESFCISYRWRLPEYSDSLLVLSAEMEVVERCRPVGFGWGGKGVEVGRVIYRYCRFTCEGGDGE